MKTIAIALALFAVPAQDDAKTKALAGWTGHVAQEACALLPKPGGKKLGNGSFAWALIPDAETWKAFATSAQAKRPEKPEVDWKTQAVVCVML